MIEVGDFFLIFFLIVFSSFWCMENYWDMPKASKFYVEVYKIKISHLGIEVGDFWSVVQVFHTLFKHLDESVQKFGPTGLP